MTRVLGLTGGIATGKSTVSRIFKSLGFSVIDADEVARQVVKPKSRALTQIQQVFGSDYINLDGSLNRAALGKRVFSDPKQLEQLNQIMQPKIRQKLKQQVNQLSRQGVAMVILEIPLLFEQGLDTEVDDTMVVVTSESTQLERLIQRNHYTRSEARNRMLSQMPLAEKIKCADVVIDNKGSVEQTRQQVVKWLENNQLL